MNYVLMKDNHFPGEIEQLQSLFYIHPYLLEHRDFLFGYTIVHWAAKLGRVDLITFATSHHHQQHQEGLKEYIDMKSFGGYETLAHY